MEEQNKEQINTQKLALSLNEAAEALSISIPTLRILVHSEGFPKIKIRSKIIIPVIALNKWLLEHSGLKEF